MKKLNYEKAQNIINRYIAGETADSLRKEFDLAKSTFCMLLRGQLWKELERPQNILEIIKIRQCEEKNNKINFHTGQEIIDRYVSGESAEELAIHFEVSRQNIMLILHGFTWEKLKRPNNIHEIIRNRSHPYHYRNKRMPKLTLHQNNLIIGSLLGDAWLTTCNGNSSFRKQQKHKEHIKWMVAELQPFSCNHIYRAKTKYIIENKNGKIYSHKTNISRNVGYCMYTIAHPIFSNMRELWYPNDIKIIPNNLTLNPETLAIWYIDDGSTSYANRSIHLSTQAFSLDEAEILLSFLKRDLQLEGKLHKEKYQSGLRPSLWFFGANYDRFMHLVKPFIIWNCFAYKIKHRYSQKII